MMFLLPMEVSNLEQLSPISLIYHLDDGINLVGGKHLIMSLFDIRVITSSDQISLFVISNKQRPQLSCFNHIENRFITERKGHSGKSCQIIKRILGCTL
jgi:hypothetical protein